MSSVQQLRLVITVDNYDEILAFYRDALGLTENAAYSAPNDGRVTLLDAGQATIELADSRQADFIDEVEVGRRVAGKIRIAFQVEDSVTATAKLVDGGATIVAEPTRTPWNSLNSRLDAPDGMPLTLFQELGGEWA
ncbi:VOC family protein [Rathayibacter soli]|uniref:VOC family protein n=1 Tax=Rathayibacter soli TaxID=3144168 RepID=UPI0027E3E284|nr:VOC family protein [Glaciibacter superstes]